VTTVWPATAVALGSVSDAVAATVIPDGGVMVSVYVPAGSDVNLYMPLVLVLAVFVSPLPVSVTTVFASGLPADVKTTPASVPVLEVESATVFPVTFDEAVETLPAASKARTEYTWLVPGVSPVAR
jgi:hypothetical protein